MSRWIRTPSPDAPRSREITDRGLYLRRREFLIGGAALLAVGCSREGESAQADAPRPDVPTPQKDATHYNNFYEFGTSKTDPAANAHTLRTRPWTITVEGEVAKPGTLGIEDVLARFPREERVYRLRCVEAWSMVIPWLGFPVGDLLRRFEPTSRAKYVQFETLFDPEQMPGTRKPILDWPYREGLRMDEAMHPLALFATGMYGEDLPNQSGAPIRLVVPWKYGFKSIKSIVKIRLVEQQPEATWNVSAPDEYGFYANVNPDVDHPRWSQRRERRIGELTKRPTLLFNGYADQVASLYTGMDLRKQFSNRARVVSVLVWIAIVAPALAIAGRIAFGDLGPDPIEALQHETGEWAIRLLFATLAVTPLRRLGGWQFLARFRRRLGLAAFAFVCVHFTLWIGFDNEFDLALIGEDIVESPYVTVGFAAFLLLVPLAITSTRSWGRRLGRRWIILHRLVYVAAVLAVIHFWWSVKEGDPEPAVYAAILGGLFVARVVTRRR